MKLFVLAGNGLCDGSMAEVVKSSDKIVILVDSKTNSDCGGFLGCYGEKLMM